MPNALYVMAGVAPTVDLDDRFKALAPSVRSLRAATLGNYYTQEYQTELLHAKLKDLERKRAEVLAREFITGQDFNLGAWIDGEYHQPGGALHVG